MIAEVRDAAGVLLYQVDTDSGRVADWTTTPVTYRTLTDGETVESLTATGVTEATNAAALRGEVGAAIDALRALMGEQGVASQDTLRGIKATTNSAINSSPAPYIKALATILISICKTVLGIARIVSDRTDSADTGGTP